MLDRGAEVAVLPNSELLFLAEVDQKVNCNVERLLQLCLDVGNVMYLPF